MLFRSEIRHLNETRQRVQAQLAQGRAGLLNDERRSNELREAEGLWQARLVEAEERFSLAVDRRAEEEGKLPEQEANYQVAQGRLAEQRAKVAETERSVDLEQAHASHAEKSLQNLLSRSTRLAEERTSLALPDAAEMQAIEEELAKNEEEMAAQHALLEKLDSEREIGRAHV